jgi:hypothetical protein
MEQYSLNISPMEYREFEHRIELTPFKETNMSESHVTCNIKNLSKKIPDLDIDVNLFSSKFDARAEVALHFSLDLGKLNGIVDDWERKIDLYFGALDLEEFDSCTDEVATYKLLYSEKELERSEEYLAKLLNSNIETFKHIMIPILREIVDIVNGYSDMIGREDIRLYIQEVANKLEDFAVNIRWNEITVDGIKPYYDRNLQKPLFAIKSYYGRTF